MYGDCGLILNLNRLDDTISRIIRGADVNSAFITCILASISAVFGIKNTNNLNVLLKKVSKYTENQHLVHVAHGV